MYKYKAIVLKITDADTIYLRVDLGFRTYIEETFRLYGINAPELNTEGGKLAKSEVEKLLPIGCQVVVDTHKDRREKFGRWLATIKYKRKNINQYLVKNGFAVPYMVD